MKAMLPMYEEIRIVSGCSPYPVSCLAHAPLEALILLNRPFNQPPIKHPKHSIEHVWPELSVVL